MQCAEIGNKNRSIRLMAYPLFQSKLRHKLSNICLQILKFYILTIGSKFTETGLTPLCLRLLAEIFEANLLLTVCAPQT